MGAYRVATGRPEGVVDIAFSVGGGGLSAVTKLIKAGSANMRIVQAVVKPANSNRNWSRMRGQSEYVIGLSTLWGLGSSGYAGYQISEGVRQSQRFGRGGGGGRVMAV